jgi:hypothetical protein
MRPRRRPAAALPRLRRRKIRRSAEGFVKKKVKGKKKCVKEKEEEVRLFLFRM